MRSGILAIISTLGLALALGCGGSGGSGGSSTSNSPVYSGKSTPAVLSSQSDVSTLTLAAMNGAQAGSVSLAATTQGGTQVARAVPNLVQTLAKVAGIIKPGTPLAAGDNFSNSVAGGCGGTASFSGSSSSGTGGFAASGVLTFSGYCNAASDGSQVVLNGSVQFSMSGTSADAFQLTLTSSYLSMTMGSLSYTMTLNYSCSYNAGAISSVSLSCFYQSSDGKVYWVDNYQVTADASANTLSISGRFYDPDYGYVDVSTPTTLVYTWCASANAYLPTSGSLEVTGANGYGEFNAVDCSQYQICYNIGAGVVCGYVSW
jgi:hypothetical protein